MGEFESGRWLIGLSIYFFIFFLLVGATIQIGNEYDTVDTGGVYQTGITFDENGTYAAAGGISDINGTDAGKVDVGVIVSSLSFASGVGTEQIGIGLPPAWQFLFSFIFFWIPAMMFLFAVYMALPFLH